MPYCKFMIRDRALVGANQAYMIVIDVVKTGSLLKESTYENIWEVLLTSSFRVFNLLLANHRSDCNQQPA